MEIVGVIPARFASTRLPGKALLSETGRPLILHVIEAARRSQSLQRIIVATDDARIAAAVSRLWRRGHDDPHRPSRPAPTALPRWRRASSDARIIVNLQGDEPEISGACARPRGRACWPTTPRHRWPPLRRRSATNRSTATRRASRSSATGAAGPFTSRAARSPAIATAFPIAATATPPVAYLHLGLYAYRRDFLLNLGSLPPSPLEAAEKLEQLRVLEAGYPIAVGLVDEPSVGIDTPEDYERFVARHLPRPCVLLLDRHTNYSTVALGWIPGLKDAISGLH